MTVLITGGNGLVASHLTALLIAKGHTVRLLSRNHFKHLTAEVFEWDIRSGYIEEGALDGVEVIIHLAGAGVAEHKWTEKRKKEIYDSRIDSTRLFYEVLSKRKQKPATFICASAIGYYGYEPFSHWSKEDDAEGKDFLAEVTIDWEKEADKIADLGIRVVKPRIGLVLSSRGGALDKIAQPIKWCVGAALGSGNQICNWIHVDDLAAMIEYFMHNKATVGAYNAVGNDPVTNLRLTQLIASALRRPLWMPNVPEFVLKILLGEMAEIVLEGHHISNQKVIDSGFKFKFTSAEDAIKDILTSD
ncbi:TIGR01777 family oxidoreductase [Reichenbachiella agarivorans]|uniref:TIGR01777 family oxidoreductase n=1 Tax=Reichenbachiella agarivorans TaxID=2979464 RepID=A0ABY6CZR7_9BACT|nr:TIGR01777 family oxidoreductase [Reichenbachiella agarivorans]UXP33735.1 TIGR01777 family oxidoreductase [Reichenbachiella agarivorans]